MYWDLYSKEFRYALKCREKAFPFSTHVKMCHEVSKALADSNPQRDSLKWIIKFLLKHTTFYNIRKSPGSDWTSLLFFMSSADNLCKQFGPRSAPTECWFWSGFYWSWSGSKAFDTLALMVFMKKNRKVNFEKISMKNYQVCKQLIYT